MTATATNAVFRLPTSLPRDTQPFPRTARVGVAPTVIHMPLKSGDKAPNFTLLDQDENKVKLSDLKGRRVLGYFDPEETRS